MPASCSLDTKHRYCVALFELVFISATALSCRGVVEGVGNTPATSSGGSGGEVQGDGGSPGGGMNGEEPQPPPVWRSAMWRLAPQQHANALRDLLGADAGPLEPFESDLFINGSSSLGASKASISTTGAEAIEKQSFTAVSAVFSSSERRKALVPCAGANGPDEACVATFVKAFARRAYSRPLTAETESAYLKVLKDAVNEGATPWDGLRFVALAILSSPRLMFRTTIGEPVPSERALMRLTGFELAERLALALWNSLPDEALLNAAEKGELETASGLQAQTDRLLKSEKVKQGLGRFLSDKFGLFRVENLQKDAAKFPSFTPALVAAMREETELTLQEVLIDKKGDFRDILDTSVSYMNEPLAKLYGMSGVTGSNLRRVVMPDGWQRRGVLGQASFLATQAHVGRTSPTLRGKFVRERLLCEEVPAPSDNVNTMLAESPDRMATVRERLEQHRKDPACSGCHALMDPVGTSFENFDALGAWAETQAGKAIDTSGDLDGERFVDFRGFVAALRKDARISSCVVRDMFRHFMAVEETDADESTLALLTDAFETGGRKLEPLVQALVQSKRFRGVGLKPSGDQP